MLKSDAYECYELDCFNEVGELMTSESNLEGYSDFYKETEESKVWWIDKLDVNLVLIRRRFIIYLLIILTT